MHDLDHPPLATLRRRVSAVVALAVLFGCGEVVTQIGEDDVFEVFVSVDSASVAIGRTLELTALPLDETGAFLSGPSIAWSSASSAIATVDATGMVTGVATGTTQIVASVAGVADTATIVVAALPALSLSDDSVHFSTTAGGADPAPGTVSITNGGGFELSGLTVDSIVYGAGASGWLTAQLTQPTAPTDLTLSATASGIVTSGTYLASAWISGLDADNSPARVRAVLRITSGLPDAIALHSGDGQSAAAGSAVATAPSVRVLDPLGNGVPGVSVTFAVASGGGSVTGANAATDASGIARVGSWTLGTAAGSGNNALTATAGVTVTGNPVTFTASATAASAATVTVVAGNGQSATVNTAVSVAPQVVVRDAFANPVPNHPVTFLVTSGGGSALPVAPINTASDGTASLTSWTLGTVTGTGNNSLSATATGVATPALFTASATAGNAAAISVSLGNNQSATVATAVSVAPMVIVRDAFGNAVAGASVTFQVTAGGGVVVPNTALISGADGSASAASWTLGTGAGSNNNSLSASAAGVVTPAVFVASGSADAPASVAIAAGNAQTGTVGTAVATAPSVIVRDQYNNPVGGASVAFAVTGGGGTVVPTTAVLTASDGTASPTSWTLGTVAGTNNNSLSATAAGSGIAGNPLAFTASATAGSANGVVVNAGNNQSASVGTAVSTAPQVLVRDAFNNPVPNVSVTFAVTGGGGTIAPVAAVMTAGDGTATATSWTLGTVAGTNNNTLSATAAGVATPATFTASATAGGAASISIVTGNNQSATVGTAVATAPQVIVRDASNNPVANVSVTFAVTGGGGAVVPVTSVLTAADGTATATSWTLGTVAGTSNNTLSATAAGVATPATFIASATAGSANSVIVNAGNNQSATVNTAVATAPQVLVRDGFNNPVPNASVTFAVTGGGGAVVPVTSVLTAANGTATATSWTLGTVAGTSNNTLSATAAGVATPATFTASATAGSANSVIVNAGNNQSATVNTAVATAPQVLVRDAFNNPVANVGVTFAVTGGGG
ncbi:MAG: hypothetical protein ABL963_03730, partial [Longimicrobiales bacterium]